MAKFMKGLGITLLVVGLIAAVAVSIMVPTVTEWGRKSFNWLWFFGLSVAALFPFGLLYSIGVVIELLEAIREGVQRTPALEKTQPDARPLVPVNQSICAKCGALNHKDAWVCAKCGDRVREQKGDAPRSGYTTCKKCGEENKSFELYCTKCGSRL